MYSVFLNSYSLGNVIIYMQLKLSGSADGTVKFWDLETFELIGSSRPEVYKFICLQNTTIEVRSTALSSAEDTYLCNNQSLL